MNNVLTVSEAARLISDRTGWSVSPRQITDLFYKRLLSDRTCPIVGGRRLIPHDYVPRVMSALARLGVFRDAAGTKAEVSP